MMSESLFQKPGCVEAPEELHKHNLGVQVPLEVALTRVSEAMKRGHSLVSTIHEPKTSATATLVLDDPLFTYATGGMLIRSGITQDLDSLSELTLSAKNSARFGSWKCWLSGLPICGGKLIVGVPEGLSEKDLRYALDWIGHEFQDVDYYGKPDVGTNSGLLEAYRLGGGKISTADLNCNTSAECEILHWKRLAKSVVEGIDEALGITISKSLRDTKVLLVGARGKIGGEILSLLEEHNANISLLARDREAELLAFENGFPYFTWNELPSKAADVLIWAGPPFEIGKDLIQNIQAVMVGGPANDAVTSQECYHLGKIIIPGAVLTSASMYVPSNIPGFEHFHTPNLEEVGLNSRNIVQRVFERLNTSDPDHTGEISLFEAFVLESEGAREDCASRSRSLSIARNFKDALIGEQMTFGEMPRATLP